MWAIELANVSYTHNAGTPFEQPALTDISLKIPAGSFSSIIGATGSGKSTLIQHFNGILAPAQGSIKVLGSSITTKKARAGLWREVGLVFQYPEQQLFEETVFDEIAFGLKNLGLNEQEIKNRINDVLSQIALPQEILTRSPFALSGGLKRRVAIAAVLAMQPKILVLDEPTAGLEPSFKNKLFAEIKEVQRRQNLTVVLVTHSMEDAARLSDLVIVLNRGKLYAQGTPQQVFSSPQKLNQIGLSVPLEVSVLLQLKKRGLPVKTDVLGLDEAAGEIAKAWEYADKSKGKVKAEHSAGG